MIIGTQKRGGQVQDDSLSEAYYAHRYLGARRLESESRMVNGELRKGPALPFNIHHSPFAIRPALGPKHTPRFEARMKSSR